MEKLNYYTYAGKFVFRDGGDTRTYLFAAETEDSARKAVEELNWQNDRRVGAYIERDNLENMCECRLNADAIPMTAATGGNDANEDGE